MTEPTTEAGRDLLAFAAEIRNFGEDWPVLSPGIIERLTPMVLAIEAEAREGVTLTREPGLDVARLIDILREHGVGLNRANIIAREYAALASEDRP